MVPLLYSKTYDNLKISTFFSSSEFPRIGTREKKISKLENRFLSACVQSPFFGLTLSMDNKNLLFSSKHVLNCKLFAQIMTPKMRRSISLPPDI